MPYSDKILHQDIVTASGILMDAITTVSGRTSRSPLLVDVGPNMVYTTIQAGIDACDTSQGAYYLVRVMPAVYNEDVVLKDNVDLVGVNYSACILNGSVSWPASTCTPAEEKTH